MLKRIKRASHGSGMISRVFMTATRTTIRNPSIRTTSLRATSLSPYLEAVTETNQARVAGVRHDIARVHDEVARRGDGAGKAVVKN